MLSTEIERVGEENEEDIEVTDPSSFNKAVLWATDWTTETVVSQLSRGNIELDPSFQRRDAWTTKRKSSFIESLILGLPTPQIILAERKDKRGSYIVIDGKQRLLSIVQFCSKSKGKFNSLKLSDLDVLRTINGMDYNDLRSQPQYGELVDGFDNQAIRTTIIKNWPDEKFLYTVFLRLNTGSLQLSPQELRQALHPGDFSRFADKYSSDSPAMRIIFKSKNPDFRMRDIELALRYYAFRYKLPDYKGNLKDFLDKTWFYLNENWAKEKARVQADANTLEAAMDITQAVFTSKNAFKKWDGKKNKFQGLFNRAVFDIMVYYFSVTEVQTHAVAKSTEIVKAFQDLCDNDVDFARSIETTTKTVENTVKRLSAWGKELEKVLSIKLITPTVSNGQVSLV